MTNQRKKKETTNNKSDNQTWQKRKKQKHEICKQMIEDQIEHTKKKWGTSWQKKCGNNLAL